MINVADFGLDANVFYFGKVCIYGHEYENTRLGLRYKKKWQCVECKKILDNNYRVNNRQEVLQRKKRYYEKVKNESWFKKGRNIYYLNNFDTIAQYQKSYRQENKDSIRQSKHDWKKRNKSKVKLSRKRYQSNNKLTRNINLIRYRSRKRSVSHIPYDKAQVTALFEKCDNKCVYCYKNFNFSEKGTRQLDHFLPISKGGHDALYNLLPACISCNSSKRDNNPHEWYSKQSFYSLDKWFKILSLLGLTEDDYLTLITSVVVSDSKAH